MAIKLNFPSFVVSKLEHSAPVNSY